MVEMKEGVAETKFGRDGVTLWQGGGRHSTMESGLAYLYLGFVPKVVGQKGFQHLPSAFDKKGLDAPSFEVAQELGKDVAAVIGLKEIVDGCAAAFGIVLFAYNKGGSLSVKDVEAGRQNAFPVKDNAQGVGA